LALRDSRRGIGRENALEIQRIRRVYGDGRTGALAAGLAEKFYGAGQRELFAREAGDEPAAADFAAQFHPAEDPREREPRHRQPLALDRAAEDDAGAAEQLPGDHLVHVVRVL